MKNKHIYTIIIFALTSIAIYFLSCIRTCNVDYVDSILAQSCGNVVNTFFLPQNQRSAKRTLLRLIQEEKHSICVACYRFTHPAYARALIQAYKRGVTVTIIADESFSNCSESMIPLLEKSGIDIYVYYCPPGKNYSLMHNKFMVFGDRFVWTGSFNFTRSALTSNCENVVLLSGRCVGTYYQHFSTLLGQCAKL